MSFEMVTDVDLPMTPLGARSTKTQMKKNQPQMKKNHGTSTLDLTGPSHSKSTMMSSKLWFAAMRGDNDALIRLITAGGDIEHKGVRRRLLDPLAALLRVRC